MTNVTDINKNVPQEQIKIPCSICDSLSINIKLIDKQNLFKCSNCNSDINEFGYPVNVFTCKTCKRPFSVSPPPSDISMWENCLGEDCDSYSPGRDPFSDAYKGIDIIKE